MFDLKNCLNYNNNFRPNFKSNSKEKNEKNFTDISTQITRSVNGTKKYNIY